MKYLKYLKNNQNYRALVDILMFQVLKYATIVEKKINEEIDSVDNKNYFEINEDSNYIDEQLAHYSLSPFKKYVKSSSLREFDLKRKLKTVQDYLNQFFDNIFGESSWT